VASAEIAEARAELAKARAAFVEARAEMAAPPLPASPPTDAVIQNIADDDDVPCRFDAPVTRSFCLRRSRP
jgi:hypothetical protein